MDGVGGILAVRDESTKEVGGQSSVEAAGSISDASGLVLVALHADIQVLGLPGGRSFSCFRQEKLIQKATHPNRLYELPSVETAISPASL